MEYFIPDITIAEREFYGENLVLLEGVIAEFLSCLSRTLTRRWN